MGTPLGTIGFINAAFELKRQTEEKKIPEPNVIFVPTASTGTAAGITAGIKLLGLRTLIHAVIVDNELLTNEDSFMQNANKALKLLRKKKQIQILSLNRDN